jgi:hypothetical protein
MSERSPEEAIREAVRNAVRELMPDAPEQTNGHAGNGGSKTGEASGAVVPLVPAPPVAAVLRPSTWTGPATPGEIVGGAGGKAPSEASPQAPAERSPQLEPAARPEQGPSAPRAAERPAPPNGTVETVTLDNDEDLQTFVRSLVTRLESPRDRLAIKAGRLRFRLRRSAASVGTAATDAAPAISVPRGAVTERQVREAHASGARLVLTRAAVLTPLARDTARALGVQIDREA